MSVQTVKISLKKQILLGIIGLLIIMSIVEILAYVVLDQKDSCNESLPMSGLYNDMNLNQLKKICQDYQSIIQYPLPIVHYEPNQITETVSINSHGFRGGEFQKEKTNDEEFRIFVLGGSVLYSLYSTSDQTTIPGFLQKYFDELDTDYNIKVINAGANAHSSFDETNLIKNKILDFEPDLIIALDGWNDLARPIVNDYEEPSDIEKIGQYSLVIRKYYKTIQFYEFIERVFEKQFQNDEKININNETIQQQKSILWKERWTEICELSQKENFDVIVTLQPYLGSGNKVLTEWENRSIKEFEGMIPSTSYYLMQEKLVQLEDKCTKTKDLTNIFDNEKELIYFDYAHVGDIGNEIIARELFEISLPVVKDKLSLN